MDGNTNRNSVCEGLDRPGVHIQNIRFGTCGRPVPWSARTAHQADIRSPSMNIRETCALTDITRSSALPASLSRSPGNRARGEENEHSIWVVNGCDGYLPLRCRLYDAPRGAAEAKTGKPTECRLDVNEERQQQEPAPSRRGRRSFRDVAFEQVELQDAGVVVGNSRVTEENCPQAAAGSVEETWPVTLDLPVLHHLETEAVPVEAQASLEVAHHHDGMVNGSGHSHRG